MTPRLPVFLASRLVASEERWGWEYREPAGAATFADDPPALAVLEPTWASELTGRYDRAMGRRRVRLLRAGGLELLAVGGLVWFWREGGPAGPIAAVLALVALGMVAHAYLALYRPRRRAARAYRTWRDECLAEYPDVIRRTAQWRANRDSHDRTESERIRATRWLDLRPTSTQRVDVYGGTPAGWDTLLAAVGGSLLNATPGMSISVVDLSPDSVSRGLVSLAGRTGHAADLLTLPEHLSAVNLLAGLDPAGIGWVLASAMSADAGSEAAAGTAPGTATATGPASATGPGAATAAGPGTAASTASTAAGSAGTAKAKATAADRARPDPDLVRRVAECVTAPVSLGRLALAVRELSGADRPARAGSAVPGTAGGDRPAESATAGSGPTSRPAAAGATQERLTDDELSALAELRRDTPAIALPALLRLGEALTELAAAEGTRSPVEPYRDPAAGLRVLQLSDRVAGTALPLLRQIVIAVLAEQIRREPPADRPRLLAITGADHLSAGFLDRLDQLLRRRSIRLMLFFRHLRPDVHPATVHPATMPPATAGATVLMRMPDPTDADRAAALVGTRHRLLASQLTVPPGAEPDRTDAGGVDGEPPGYPHEAVVHLGAARPGMLAIGAAPYHRAYRHAVAARLFTELSPTGYVLVDPADGGSPRLGDCDPTVFGQHPEPRPRPVQGEAPEIPRWATDND